MNSIQVLLLAAGVLLLVSLTSAHEFINPPETDDVIVPPDGWESSFPYQRNVMVDFGTNPDTWPDPGANDEIPSAYQDDAVDFQDGDNYALQGTNDPDWKDSDWGAGDGVEWFDDDPTQQTTRQGMIGFYDAESQDGFIVLHLDNDPVARPLKHFYLEMELFSAGGGNLGMPDYDLSVGDVTDYNVTTEVTSDGWTRMNVWVEFQPNPEWEEMSLDFFTSPTASSTVLVDYIHIATECVPEPATMTMLAIGAVALIRRPRR